MNNKTKNSIRIALNLLSYSVNRNSERTCVCIEPGDSCSSNTCAFISICSTVSRRNIIQYLESISKEDLFKVTFKYLQVLQKHSGLKDYWVAEFELLGI